MIRRGEIWWADLPEPVGSEPGFRRPVVIIQAESFNRSQLRTVIVVSLTSNLRLRDQPGNVFLPKGLSDLPRDCVANVSQVATIDRNSLLECVGELLPSLFGQIEEGLRFSMSL